MVIVMGAGIAGLVCAHELERGGEEVILLEASGRVGGRCYTDMVGFSVPVDLGASWIHGHRYNPLMQWARRYACDIVETPYAKLAYYDGSGKLPAERAAEGKAFVAWLDEWCEKLCYRHPRDRPDISVAAAMAQDIDRGRTTIKLDDMRIFDWSLCAKGLDEGVDLGKVTLRYYEDDDPFEGKDYLFVRGYQELTESIADGLDVRFGSRVERVVYGDQGCDVHIKGGEVLHAERVVCTLPLGVLKRQDVQFDPPLPAEKEAAIERLGVGVLNKIVVEFERAFWGKEVVLGKLSGPYRHAAWMLNLKVFTKAPILVGFVAGDAPSDDLDDEQVLDHFLSDLEACFGDAVSRVKRYCVTRWQHEEFARGSYAYVPVGATGRFYDVMAAPVDGRVHFAGEATHRDHPGTVHGAMMSGLRAAEEVISGIT